MTHIPIKFVDLPYPVGLGLEEIKSVTLEFKRALQKLKLPKGSTINLWCRGSSGSILATALSLSIPYKVCITHTKKDGETCHGGKVSGFFDGGVNIVIDDFVCSGTTIREILKAMEYRRMTPLALMLAYGYSILDSEISDKFKYVISS